MVSLWTSLYLPVPRRHTEGRGLCVTTPPPTPVHLGGGAVRGSERRLLGTLGTLSPEGPEYPLGPHGRIETPPRTEDSRLDVPSSVFLLRLFCPFLSLFVFLSLSLSIFMPLSPTVYVSVSSPCLSNVVLRASLFSSGSFYLVSGSLSCFSSASVSLSSSFSLLVSL